MNAIHSSSLSTRRGVVNRAPTVHQTAVGSRAGVGMHSLVPQLAQPTPVRAASVIVRGFGFGKKQNEGPKTCECGSKVAYEECCGPYHAGAKLPETAEKLMRSRYTAYCRGHNTPALVDYIVNTTHPDNAAHNGTTSPDGKIHTTLKADITATCRTCAFQKLKVTATEDGSNPDEAFVSFVADFKIVGQKGDRQAGSKLQQLKERSRFLRVDGKWMYIDGVNNWEHHTYEKKMEDAVKNATAKAVQKINEGN